MKSNPEETNEAKKIAEKPAKKADAGEKELDDKQLSAVHGGQARPGELLPAINPAVKLRVKDM